MMSRDLGSPNALRTFRPALLGLARAFTLAVSTVAAVPLRPLGHIPDEVPEEDGAALWILYVISMALVLLGGAFAGLTIALMGQDGIYLQVIAEDFEDPQRSNAKRVHRLLSKGKHWVLVTLLLSNVIVNETLPVVLDRCFGGGVAAVVGSTVLIVIFGEVIPQSLCVRYGLTIGGYMSRPVLLLMYVLAPVAWPTAKLLDWLLGEDHGTLYKKSGLKTLVTLHKSLGDVSERLNDDEVTIINAVLDLKRKPVEAVMTPMDDVYTMSEDTVLDEAAIKRIYECGYSRIPIHQVGNPNNFVGMLLVRILIQYDPEDGKRVSDFALATLPETRPETSCLDIINFFQEGKSHMVLVSEYPGEDHGALGVITLEDVIEELIGEEIIDESDVFVDVHKAIRRTHPAPKARVQRKDLLIKDTAVKDGNLIDLDDPKSKSEASKPVVSLAAQPSSSSSLKTTLLMRRSSAGQDGQLVQTTVPIKANYEEMRDHLKHLGPSNPAANPKTTRINNIKIKPGHGLGIPPRSASVATDSIAENADGADGADERTSLLRSGSSVNGGVSAGHPTYRTAIIASPRPEEFVSDRPEVVIKTDAARGQKARQDAQSQRNRNAETTSPERTTSSGSSSSPVDRKRSSRHARSGSITENVIEQDGIRKVILEASISSEDGEVTLAGTPTVLRTSSTGTGGLGTLSEEFPHEPGSAGASTANGTASQGSDQARSNIVKKKNKKKRKGGR